MWWGVAQLSMNQTRVNRMSLPLCTILQTYNAQLADADLFMSLKVRPLSDVGTALIQTTRTFGRTWCRLGRLCRILAGDPGSLGSNRLATYRRTLNSSINEQSKRTEIRATAEYPATSGILNYSFIKLIYSFVEQGIETMVVRSGRVFCVI